MPFPEIIGRMRFERARKHTRDASISARPASLPSRVWHFAGLLVVWALGSCLIGSGNLGSGLSNLLMNAATLFVLGFCGQQLLAIVTPSAASRRTYWTLMVVLIIFALGEARLYNDVLYARFIVPFLPEGARLFAYPNAIVPFLAAMLYGGPAALVIGVITGAAISVSSGEAFNLGAYIIALCPTCVIANEAPRIARRSQMATIALRAGAMQFLVVLILLYRQPGTTFGQKVLQGCAFYALLGASTLVFAFVVLPLAEWLTKRVSNIGIGRLADLEQPLLRRLSLEAPGTYHHAMMVGDLAQTAAEAIGANGVLARVGAYYHDIGKLSCPHFYMENQSGIGNPHDTLPPNISRMVIVNHVKEGLVLAKLNHLPPVVSRFIATHHGTGVARWFLLKERKRLEARGAKAERNDDPADDFRYRGPLPVTREETIVSLADSVEAASRAMRFFDRAKIEGLVNGIVQERWADGQLAESELSGAELDKVRVSFVSTLVHLLHGRLPYPSQK